VITYVQNNGGIEYATKKMNQIKNEALQLLSNIPDCPAKESLIELIIYTIERSN